MLASIQIYDILLALALVGAAWRALFGRVAFTSTVFFVVYGLFMSMAWVQLGAVDIALAEACIGAGLTGALLIGAIKRFECDPTAHRSRVALISRMILGCLSAILFIGLAGALFLLRNPKNVIQPLVMENLSSSGSTHPVTAMLLNFRAFDTWLELGVLMIAAIAAAVIHQIYDRHEISVASPTLQHQPAAIARIMLILLFVLGGALLWFGSHSPGGAFQAGALIGAAGILIQLSGQKSFIKFSSIAFRAVLTVGFVAFIVVGALTFAIGGRLLEYPQSFAGAIILALEVAATASIALTINAMYAFSQPAQARGV